MQSSTSIPDMPSTGIVMGRAAHRVSLACLPCRQRHLKCNAAKPICSRCSSDEVDCNYTRSRRGFRHPKKPDEAGSAVPKTRSPQDAEYPLIPSPSSSSNSAGNTHTGSSRNSTALTLPVSICSETALSDLDCVDEDLIGLYYTYFHASHPCVLPRWALKHRRTAEPELFTPVVQVMQFIGSLFDPAVSTEPLKELAGYTLPLAPVYTGEVTPHHVQAMLLYSTALYWCDEVEESLRFLNLTIELAVKLSMNTESFAIEHGQGDPVLAESWRRTWWQLYITDGHIAGSTHTFPTRTGHVNMTALLPCEEECYESGNIPIYRSLSEYNVREFLPDEDPGFSSFAHLVGLTRALDLVLMRHVRTDENMATICSQVDISLSAWYSLLPRRKRSVLDNNRKVDVQLFKANMLVNTYIVDLHRQLSGLAYSEVEAVARCAPPAPPAKLRQSNSEETHLHTSKAIAAFRRIGDLLHLPANIVTCTPFIICMIANTLVAHLSACRYIFRDRTLQLERERVRSSMGVLRLLGEYWPLGKRTYRELGIIAREILALADQDIPCMQSRTDVPAQAQSDSQQPLAEMSLDPDVPWFDFDSLSQGMLAPSCDYISGMDMCDN